MIPVLPWALALVFGAAVGDTVRKKVRTRAGTARPVRRVVRAHLDGDPEIRPRRGSP